MAGGESAASGNDPALTRRPFAWYTGGTEEGEAERRRGDKERGNMISPDLLEILRCPMDPSRTRLALEGDHLVCERCRLIFKIKDGFPILIAEEAELPPGVASLEELPCQKEK